MMKWILILSLVLMAHSLPHHAQQQPAQQRDQQQQQQVGQPDHKPDQNERVADSKADVVMPSAYHRRRDNDDDNNNHDGVTELSDEIPDQWCWVDPGRRTDCGYPGITEKICEHIKQCCWDDDIPQVPWCFHPKRV